MGNMLFGSDEVVGGGRKKTYMELLEEIDAMRKELRELKRIRNVAYTSAFSITLGNVKRRMRIFFRLGESHSANGDILIKKNSKLGIAFTLWLIDVTTPMIDDLEKKIQDRINIKV